MPGGDKTGPEGNGPMTGKRQGYCVGNDGPGGNFGRGRRPGRGRGNGLRRGLRGRSGQDKE